MMPDVCDTKVEWWRRYDKCCDPLYWSIYGAHSFRNTIKKIISSTIPQNLIVPDTWNTLEEFAQWFKDHGYPMRVPANMQIYVTDSTYSCVVFRQDVYQAELYMIAPNMPVAKHSHSFESLTILVWWSISGMNERASTKKTWDSEEGSNIPYTGVMGEKLVTWNWHWFETFSKGCFMYVLQKWNPKIDLTSATLEYSGESMWPLHTILMQKYKDTDA